jgi:hypothetical protein
MGSIAVAVDKDRPTSFVNEERLEVGNNRPMSTVRGNEYEDMDTWVRKCHTKS